MTGRERSFSVFIPAYNAGGFLPRTLKRIPQEIRNTVKTVWIVNDGSTDRTAEIINEAAVEYPRIRGIHLEHNRGYGGAVKEALQMIREEGATEAVCLHADGQYAPEEMPRLLALLRQRRLDVLQGSRLASGTALSGGMPLYKYAAGRLLTCLENFVFNMRMSDYHSGYMLYGARALELIPFNRLSDSFDFDLEVIASARSLGLKVGEAPVPTHYGEEESHLNPITYGLRVLRVLWRYSRRHYLSGAKD